MVILYEISTLIKEKCVSVCLSAIYGKIYRTMRSEKFNEASLKLVQMHLRVKFLIF